MEEGRPIGGVWRGEALEHKPISKIRFNKTRKSQDTYDRINASKHREQLQQDTVEISQAYREARKAYEK
ncbi:TPA: hypothetical protein DCR79_00700 [Patescibacteria group bacterium]|nr:hypothetical protein [Patescibacteria group bacterium]HCR42149.1 hypothetical protein [Patescibacteria group bacterium]